MQFKEDPKNLIVPLDLTKIIYETWDADLAILDRPDQVYGKALHGKGSVKFKNGNSYEGEFYNGMLHGRGRFTWSTGVIYEGDFYYNRITGTGVYEWPDGSRYDGSVLNGLRHGLGKFIANGETAVYEGQWENGLRHGEGKVLFKSGAVYTGQFINGNKQGKGKMLYPSQNYYEGDFYIDKKCGFGTMNWLTSAEKYYGQWADNMQNGWGIHIWLEPKGEGSKFLRNRYEGQWENGERNGFGVFYYANGAKYLGEWRANLKEGRAVFITDSGGLILGDFKQDRLKKVISTTENESRTGILPREIAPQNKEEQAILEDQLTRKKPDQIVKRQSTPPKKPEEKKKVNQQAEKLAGLNSPGNQTGAVTGAVNPKNIETNPYSYMIDISDLFRGINVNQQQIEQNVQQMLLRHNSTALRTWYKFFATKYEHLLSEDTFALNLEGFWKIVRDSKLLNPNFTLAQLNRLFLQGCKNEFPLNYQEDQLTTICQGMKKYGEQMSLNDMGDIFHINLSRNLYETVRQERLNYDQTNSPQITFSKAPAIVHDPLRVILFRHYIELLVRLAYLKYGSLNELHRAIEKIILNKLTPFYERKKGKGLNQSQSDAKSTTMKNKVNFEEYINEIKPIFEKFGRNQYKKQYGYIDQTITVQDVYNLLKKAGMLNESDKTLIIALVEKDFDTDEGSLNQQSSVDQSSVNQTKTEDKQKRRQKQQANDAHQENQKEKDKQNKMDKWVIYQNYELILFEFADLLISYLTKKNKDLSHPKEEEQRNRIIAVLGKLGKVRVKEEKKKTIKRVWPKSVKDGQKDQLKYLRIQQEAMARQRLLLEEERRNEERERNLMELENVDIKSNYDEDEGSEESDY